MLTMELLFFHEQVKGPNLLGKHKFTANEQVKGSNLLGIDFANAAGRNHLRKMPNMVLPLPDIAA